MDIKYGGEMILKDDEKNKIFSCGSMIFCGSLLVDKNIERLILNIYNYFRKIIFVLGFSKTGTTSMNYFFQKLKLNSTHHNYFSEKLLVILK